MLGVRPANAGPVADVPRHSPVQRVPIVRTQVVAASRGGRPACLTGKRVVACILFVCPDRVALVGRRQQRRNETVRDRRSKTFFTCGYCGKGWGPVGIISAFLHVRKCAP